MRVTVTIDLTDHQAAVLRWARSHMTTFTDRQMVAELSRAWPGKASNWRSRRAELVRYGLMEFRGKGLEHGSQGRPISLWRATDPDLHYVRALRDEASANAR